MKGGQEKNTITGNLSNVGTVNIGDHIHSPEAKLPQELTLNLPKTHPDDIIGRETDLEELHTLLSADKRVVVVNGLGGIGKTTLAQVYVHKYYEDYHHIVWIAQDSDNIANDIINTAGLIENLAIKSAEFQPQQLFHEVIMKLKGIADKPNLLIIDNAEQSIKQYLNLLPSQPQWHLLVTSREEITGMYLKPLDFLSEKQAIELFKNHYTHKKLSDDQIKAVVLMVDLHTLTIEILAKTAEVLRYDIDTLQKAIESDLKGNLEISHNRKHGDITKIASYLGTVFNLSELNEAEIWLMKQFACLPAEFHTYDLLKDLLIDEESVYADVFAETLNSLGGKGWLLQNKVVDSYKMHRIIADVVRKQQTINIDDVKILINSITRKFQTDPTEDNFVETFIWIPFGKALLTSFGEETFQEIALLQNNLAVVLIEKGDYINARQLMEKAIVSYEKNLQNNDPDLAKSYNNMALALRGLGDYHKAKGLFKKAIKLYETYFYKGFPVTSSIYSNLANVLKDLGDYNEAKKMLEKAITLNEKHHIIQIDPYNNLALVLQKMGDYQGAKELLEKANALDGENFGNNHPKTSITYANLALVLNDIGDYVRAKELAEKAVTLAETSFGQDHPTTAVCYSTLAMALQNLGDYRGAKEFFEKAIISDERNFGENHPGLASKYHNLATTYCNLRNYSNALEFSNRALSIVKKVLPASHPDIKTVNKINQLIKSKIEESK